MAAQQLEKCLAVNQEIGRRSPTTMIALGLVMRMQGDFEAAERLLDQSVEQSKADGDQSEVASSLSNLGCLAYDRGEYRLAEQLLQESLSILKQTENERDLAAALSHMGHLMVALDGTLQTEARHYFGQALELAAEQKLAPIALDVFVGIAKLLALAGKVELGIELLSLAKYHSASTFETKEKAHQQLAELTVNLTAEIVITAKARVPATSVCRLSNQLTGLRVCLGCRNRSQ